MGKVGVGTGRKEEKRIYNEGTDVNGCCHIPHKNFKFHRGTG